MVIPIQVNAATNEQNFYHIHRKKIEYIDMPEEGPYRFLKNDLEFFHMGKKLQDEGNSDQINDFFNKFFTYKSLFGCIYLMAYDDSQLREKAHIPVFRVQ